MSYIVIVNYIRKDRRRFKRFICKDFEAKPDVLIVTDQSDKKLTYKIDRLISLSVDTSKLIQWRM